MAQPALNQNTQQARRAELEARRAQKRNEAAQKARANLRLVKGRQPNQTDSRQEKTQQKRNEAAQKSRQRMSELASGQNTSTVDPQRLQAVSGERQAGPENEQQAPSRQPLGANDGQKSRQVSSELPESTQQAQLMEQQFLERNLNRISEIDERQRSPNQQQKDENLGRISDLITGTATPTTMAVDASTGLVSFVVTFIIWFFLLGWLNLKAYLGPKVKGTPLGYVITPLKWKSMVSALNFTGIADDTLEEMWQSGPYLALGFLDFMIFLGIVMFATTILIAGYALITIGGSAVNFLTAGGGTYTSLILEFL